MADAAKRRGRKRNKPIDLEEIAKQRQWAGKEAAKEKEEQFRSALQLPFWREGEQPKVGDYLMAYWPYKRKADSGFFIGKIENINRENFDTQYFIRFLFTDALEQIPFHWLQPIYTYMKSEGNGRNCRTLKDENGNFYDLEKSCVVRFLNKASATNYKKTYKGKEPKKRKREVQEQKAPPLLAPPKRTAMAAGPSSRQKEKPGPKGDWMRAFFKQETENDSETDSEPEPDEESLPEASVLKKLLLF